MNNGMMNTMTFLEMLAAEYAAAGKRVKIFLMGGFQYTGVIQMVYRDGISVLAESGTVLIPYHAISTVIPVTSV